MNSTTPPNPTVCHSIPPWRNAKQRTETAAFEDEPYDLVAEMPKFNWPTVVVSGGRDLITPRAVAERVASLVPNAVLLALPTMAHSALDFREAAALAIAGAVSRGEIDGLAVQAPALDALPPRPAIRLLWKAIEVAATAEAALPAAAGLVRMDSWNCAGSAAGWPAVLVSAPSLQARRAIERKISWPASSRSAPYESDRRVVHVGQSGRAVVGQIASYRDVAGRLEQRQVEAFLPDHRVDLVGEYARLVLVQLGQRLIDLGVDRGVADFAEVAVTVRGVYLRQRGQRESVTRPTELNDIEVADAHVLAEEAGARFRSSINLTPICARFCWATRAIWRVDCASKNTSRTTSCLPSFSRTDPLSFQPIASKSLRAWSGL